MKRSLALVLLSVAAALRAARRACCPRIVPTCCCTPTTAAASRFKGPSVLVRKQFAQKFSVSANHYVDKVSSASIDVVTTASPYTEERTQHSVGLDYLHDRWMMNVGFTNSEENDYTAETVQLRPEPGHLRRPDDGVARLLARQRHGRPARRRRISATRRAPAVRLGVIADSDEESAARPVVRDDHGRRLPQQPVSPSALRRHDHAAGLQLRTRDVSAHALERCGLHAFALLLAVSRGGARRVPPVRRHLGHRSRYVRARLHASDRAGLDDRRQVPFYSQTRRTSTAICSRARGSRTSWRATRSSARSRARRCGSA